jgi:ABC-2 type transport system permease protein
MLSIYLKELRSSFNSLIAYIVMAIFLVAVGLFVWIFPDTSVLAYGYADLGTLFSIAPFVLMFLVPAITMRTFAEERKAGTLELLYTMPITDWEIVIGKYLASVSLVLFSLLPTLLYYLTLYLLGNPKGNIDSAGVFGSYLGLALLGAGFCSIGVLASALTDSQIVAFVLATFLCFMLYMGFGSLATIDIWQQWSVYVSQLGIAYHYNAMSKGLIDTRNLVYFASLITLALYLTRFATRARLH